MGGGTGLNMQIANFGLPQDPSVIPASDRLRVASFLRKKHDFPKKICVRSGESGIGQTLVCVLLAERLRAKGQRVLIIDLSDDDQFLRAFGMFSDHDPEIKLTCSIGPNDHQVIWFKPEQLFYDGLFPQCTGVLEQISRMAIGYDIVIVDCNGINGFEPLDKLLPAFDTDHVLVTTPDKQSVIETYGLLKRGWVEEAFLRNPKILVNRVQDVAEGDAAFRGLAGTAKKFLKCGVESVGSVS